MPKIVKKKKVSQQKLSECVYLFFFSRIFFSLPEETECVVDKMNDKSSVVMKTLLVSLLLLLTLGVSISGKLLIYLSLTHTCFLLDMSLHFRPSSYKSTIPNHKNNSTSTFHACFMQASDVRK